MAGEEASFITWLITKSSSMPSPSSILKKLSSTLPFLSNKASPPPLLPVAIPGADVHPVIETLREHELGKLVFSLALPATVAFLLSTQKLLETHHHVIVVGLVAGCMTTWNGILFRKPFPRLANILEQLGLSIILLFLYGLVASFLHKAFSWACWLCGVFCLTPFVYAGINRQTAAVQA